MIDYLGLADLIALHIEVMTRLGLQPVRLRDEEGLKGVLTLPQAAAHYRRADLVGQAAVLAVGLAQLQPFAAGNHPTAYAAMELFLSLNGRVRPGDPLRLAQYLMAIAGEHDLETATALFEARLRAEVIDR